MTMFETRIADSRTMNWILLLLLQAIYLPLISRVLKRLSKVHVEYNYKGIIRVEVEGTSLNNNNVVSGLPRKVPYKSEVETKDNDND